MYAYIQNILKNHYKWILTCAPIVILASLAKLALVTALWFTKTLSLTQILFLGIVYKVLATCLVLASSAYYYYKNSTNHSS
ncbi:MAG: hypothetical protein VXZ73_02495 [Pseudomonadota bacterium]|nr:hypothetical protein [Pseudomonadota bacterium]MEC8978344.1 hypothetical protein [Pseudomonadota bacterium]